MSEVSQHESFHRYILQRGLNERRMYFAGIWLLSKFPERLIPESPGAGAADVGAHPAPEERDVRGRALSPSGHSETLLHSLCRGNLLPTKPGRIYLNANVSFTFLTVSFTFLTHVLLAMATNRPKSITQFIWVVTGNLTRNFCSLFSFFLFMCIFKRR